MSLQDLQPASFRNFRFLTPRSRLVEGRKTATHEFVNSKNRFVEDLGEFPSKFTVTAIIHGTNSIQQRDSFRTILNQPGPGILVHPSYGRQTATVEGQYTVSDSDRELGQFLFEIKFALDAGAAFPRQGLPTSSSVAASELVARESILQSLEDKWAIPESTTSNLDASTKLAQYANDISNRFSGIVEDSSDIQKVTGNVVDNSTSIVRDGSSLAGSIGEILGTLDEIPTESLGTLNSIKKFLDFGADDLPIMNPAGFSIDQANRILNQDIFNSAIQSTSLTKAYTTSTLVDFEISSRLDENRLELFTSSRKILDFIRNSGSNFDAASAAGIKIGTSRDSGSINSILDTRSLSEKIMSEKTENLYRLSNVQANKSSARLLSYTLFESDEQTPIIANLNATQKPSRLTGDLVAINR